ncbi:MAG: hypothetical protein WCO58_00460 [bacterium]
MIHKEILDTILTSRKTLVEYYTYPTGTYGDSVIAEVTKGKLQSDPLLVSFIDVMIQLGAAVAGYSNDNKTAVKVYVEDFGTVYFVKYDSDFFIVTKINQLAGSSVVKINWKVE